MSIIDKMNARVDAIKAEQASASAPPEQEVSVAQLLESELSPEKKKPYSPQHLFRTCLTFSELMLPTRHPPQTPYKPWLQEVMPQETTSIYSATAL